MACMRDPGRCWTPRTAVRRSHQNVLRTLTVMALLAMEITGRGQTPATRVSIDAAHPIPVPSRRNFAGGNMQIMFTGESYLDPKVQAMLSGLNLGWMRFPGGTLDDVWDWRTGLMRPDWIAKFANEKEKVYDRFVFAEQVLRGKGGNTIEDYAKLLGTLRTSPEGTPGSSPTHTIGVINTFTDSPASAAELALAAEKKNLHVDVWELGNEPFYFKDIYPTGAAYLAAAEPYAKAIKAAVPTAKVAVYIQRNDEWLASMAAYKHRYWDEIYWHPYPGAKEGNLAQKMAFYNEFLENTTNRWIDKDLVKLFGPAMKLEVSEYGVGDMRGGQFAAVFLAEFMLRLSSDAHVTQAGMHILIGRQGNGDNAIGVTDDHTAEITKAASEGKTVDTTRFDYGLYYTPYGLVMQIIDPVLATSNELFPTTVTDGTMVSTGEKAGINAVYAQAYRSAGNGNHLLLTNKSGSPQTVTIVMNGQPVHAVFHIRSVGAEKPNAQNTPEDRDAVKITTTVSQDSFTVPAYGVVDAAWPR